MGRGNLLDDYERAQRVALDWAETARTTGSARHIATAVACSRIAAERLEALLARRPETATAGRVWGVRVLLAAEVGTAELLDLVEASQTLLRRLDGAIATAPREPVAAE